jgi:hypothetical protein
MTTKWTGKFSQIVKTSRLTKMQRGVAFGCPFSLCEKSAGIFHIDRYVERDWKVFLERKRCLAAKMSLSSW